MIEINRKIECTGCTACYSACPRQCIAMKKDEEGFFYPVVNEEKCIDCNLCVKICPQKNVLKGKADAEQSCFAVKSNDYYVWKSSASGGAFTEICRVLDNGDTVFYGAAFDHMVVKHIGIVDFEKIEPIRRSKYVSSYLGKTFNEIKEYLNKGSRVVFSGTPCQIAGLRAYLKKEYDNLYLVDFICHGVGSPDVFLECMKIMSNDYNLKIADYSFRVKNGPFHKRYINEITFENGKKKLVEQDRYMQLFLTQRCLRPVCISDCLYRNSNRQSDITLADFKGIEEEFTQLKGTKYNFTTVVFNTQKGRSIKAELEKNSTMLASSIERVKKDNPLFYRNTNTDSTDRDLFFDSYTENGELAIIDNTVPTTPYKKNVKRIVYDLLPFSIRHVVKEFRKYGK